MAVILPKQDKTGLRKAAYEPPYICKILINYFTKTRIFVIQLLMTKFSRTSLTLIL